MKYTCMILSNVGHNIGLFTEKSKDTLRRNKIGQGIPKVFIIFWAKREET
jgi:hypothetical protein